MAVTNEKSTQVTKLTASPKQELSVKERDGRVRMARVDYTQSAAAGDIGSTQELCQLPAGARILGNLSFLAVSAFGAARTLDIGTRAHRNAQTGALVPEAAASINSAVDVSAAVRFSLAADANGPVNAGGDTLTFTGEVFVFSTVAGGTIPAGATIKGDIAYIVD
jgi:hypothetical protein